MSEGPFRIPKNWMWAKMGEIASVTGGGTPKTDDAMNYEGGTIPWLTPADLSGYTAKYIGHGSRFLTEKGLKTSSARMMPKGTVLFTSRAPIGYVAIASNPVCTNQGFKSFILKEGVLPDYVYWWLKGSKDVAEGLASGTTFLELSGAKAVQIPIPIAPLAQQQRIVGEIEKQFSRLDEAIANLKRVKANLKRYKAAVLKAAVEGKLTEQWRKKDPDVEPASKLLERILVERRAKWEAGQRANMKAKGRTPRDDSWKKKHKGPALPIPIGPSSLPEKWVWASPDMLAEFEENAICAGPFGTIFKAKDFRHSGVPIIFLRHVSPGKYLVRKPGFMESGKWKELFQPYSVYGGELLVTKLGEPPGACAIYPSGIGPAMVTPDVMKMSVNTAVVETRYLMHYFNSQIAKRFAIESAFGTTRLRLTLPIFRQTPVPLPPLTEQKHIVAEIESYLSISEEIETAVEASLQRAERLRQSIMKKAFSGQLVPSAFDVQMPSIAKGARGHANEIS